jgi:hypothetical protein
MTEIGRQKDQGGSSQRRSSRSLQRIEERFCGPASGLAFVSQRERILAWKFELFGEVFFSYSIEAHRYTFNDERAGGDFIVNTTSRVSYVEVDFTQHQVTNQFPMLPV